MLARPFYKITINFRFHFLMYGGVKDTTLDVLCTTKERW